MYFDSKAQPTAAPVSRCQPRPPENTARWPAYRASVQHSIRGASGVATSTLNWVAGMTRKQSSAMTAARLPYTSRASAWTSHALSPVHSSGTRRTAASLVAIMVASRSSQAIIGG